MQEKIIGTLNDEVDPVSQMTEEQKMQLFARAVEEASQKYGYGMEPNAILGPDCKVKRLYIEVVRRS